MTHKPPLPEAATPPWPATPAPHVANDGATDSARRDEEPERIGGVDKRIVAGVAGIAVGSAAIAAALLFSGRLNRPKSASAPVPPPPAPGAIPAEPAAPGHLTHGDASEIKVG
ncbi:MAG: hypothetical protein JWL91_1051 [Sphingomonas bacterium]|jgi:hypothetical protein|nr:hypothetical protein [Sphingomonas bacterium]MDB5689175.1 hypothetical protein [Sphingomonas bacterium]